MMKLAQLDRVLAPSRLIALLVAVAVLMRAVVPAGYMVSVTADGPLVTLCGGGDAVALVFNPQTGEVAPVEPGHQNRVGDKSEPCAFAFAAGDAVNPETFTTKREAYFAARVRAVIANVARTLAKSKTVSPRGPPAII